MTYVTGGLVQAADYNGFNGNLNAVWNTSYGQPATANVSVGNTVNANSWANLNTNLSNTASHQGTGISSRPTPQQGNIVAVLFDLGNDIANINTNKFNASTQGTQFTGWTGNASALTGAGSGTSAWTITFTDTVTFANANAASYFFNAGATIKIQFSKTSTGTTTDSTWNSLVNTTCGNIFLSSTGTSKTINGQTYTGTTKIGGNGTPAVLATSTGFAQLTSTPAIIYKQFASGYVYSGDYVQVTAAYAAPILTLITTWHSPSGNTAVNITGGTATTGITFGTAPATVLTYFPPETTHLANVWGTPTVASTVATSLV
jgi:hypothetical protein